MVDLAPFCSPETTRPALSQPWSHGDFTYATDGRIFIRVPRRPGIGECVPGSEQYPHRIEKYIAEAISSGRQFQSLPEGPFPERVRDCDECQGIGRCTCFYCTTKDVVCPVCKGKGGIRPPTIDLAPRYTVDAELLALILALPNPRMMVPEKASGLLLFDFDGGIGGMMPMLNAQRRTAPTSSIN